MNSPRVASSCAPYKIQNPSEAQNTPQNTPRILSPNQNTEKHEKITKTPDFCVFFVFFFVFFSYFGFGCILGCILALREVLYSVGGARTRNPRVPSCQKLWHRIALCGGQRASSLRTRPQKRVTMKMVGFVTTAATMKIKQGLVQMEAHALGTTADGKTQLPQTTAKLHWGEGKENCKNST